MVFNIMTEEKKRDHNSSASRLFYEAEWRKAGRLKLLVLSLMKPSLKRRHIKQSRNLGGWSQRGKEFTSCWNSIFFARKLTSASWLCFFPDSQQGHKWFPLWAFHLTVTMHQKPSMGEERTQWPFWHSSDKAGSKHPTHLEVFEGNWVAVTDFVHVGWWRWCSTSRSAVTCYTLTQLNDYIKPGL